ncbi:MAG: DUF547 domain-containing protein [Deltaproteobacteria bacterium]|nr:DUF547 domain-containing protein [Deltaproteobacteria bacterium]
MIVLDRTDYNGALRGLVDERGWINFRELLARRDQIDRFLSKAARVNAEMLRNRSVEDRKAYWFCVYHGLLVASILDHYPPERVRPVGAAPDPGDHADSVRRVPGFWTARAIRAGGERHTLRSIENDVLWKEFPDPRWPFVLARGGRSGAPIPAELPGGVRFDSYLDRRVQSFFRQRENYYRSGPDKTLFLSPVLLWDRERIMTQEGGPLPVHQSRPVSRWEEEEDAGDIQILLRFIMPFLDRQERMAIDPENYKIRYSYFDWRLPDTSPPAAPAPGSEAGDEDRQPLPLTDAPDVKGETVGEEMPEQPDSDDAPPVRFIPRP